MASKLDVTLGLLSGVIIGAMLMDARDSFGDVASWTKKGTCAKEFGPEARARGYTVPESIEKVEFDARISYGICTAEFPDGKGGTARFSWKANQGTHVPAAAASAAPAASAP